MVREAFKDFAKPAPAVDSVIFRVVNAEVTSNRGIARKAMQVLLVREKKEGAKWQLPGTMIRLGEKASDALDRVAKTKANMKNIYFEQLYTVDNDPERDFRGHIISIVYIGVVKPYSEVEISTNDENMEYEQKWFWIENRYNDKHERILTSTDEEEKVIDLKYDHKTILEDAIKRLKGKLMYSDIGFKFVTDEFTVKDLEYTFCAINMNPIPGFRRIITPKIEGTGKLSDGKAYRPAELFKLKARHEDSEE